MVAAVGQAAIKLRHRTPEERGRARATPPESETRTTPLRCSQRTHKYGPMKFFNRPFWER